MLVTSTLLFDISANGSSVANPEPVRCTASIAKDELILPLCTAIPSFLSVSGLIFPAQAMFPNDPSVPPVDILVTLRSLSVILPTVPMVEIPLVSMLTPCIANAEEITPAFRKLPSVNSTLLPSLP